ncbi:hypothetical protein REPUB_Repub16aG0098000 [Reevesia pubescens]
MGTLPRSYSRIPGDKLSDGLVLLHNEITGKKLKGYLFEHCTVELYIDHRVDVPNDCFGVGEDVVVDEFNDGLDVVCDVGGDKLNDEDEHEVFLIDVACLNDNDDEDIEAIREKVKNFKERKGKKIDEVNDLEIPVNIGYANSLSEGFRVDESEGERVNDEVGETRVNESTNSSDPGDYESEQSGEDKKGVHRVKKSKSGPRYDPRCLIPVWELGMRFQNNKQFKEAVKKYAFAQGVQLRFKKNEPKRVRVRCMEGYPLSLFASHDSRNHCFVIKTYNPEHRCFRTNKIDLISADYITEHLKDIILSQPNMKIRDLKDLCRT